MRRNTTLLDVLLELQVLDRVPRSGYSLRGIADPESVSEHCFHLVFLVWALAADEPDLDRLRAVGIALAHDLAEVRTGDLPRTAAHYLPLGAKAAAEAAAAADLLAPLGEPARQLLVDYKDPECAEGRFVSACDKLQLLIKAHVYESWGAAGLDEFWQALEEFPDAGFATIRRLVDELKLRRRSVGETATV